MENKKIEDIDRIILRAICNLMLHDTDAEFADILEANPELRTERAQKIMAITINDIPPDEKFLREEWERRARFLQQYVDL
jgi:hypothetical protein